jgi:hypothetical protein
MLETISKGFRSVKHRLQGKRELTEENIDEALRDIRVSLLEADVDFKVVRQFVASVKEKAVGEVVRVKVTKAGESIRINPGDYFIKLCQDELEALMGPVDSGLKFGAGSIPGSLATVPAIDATAASTVSATAGMSGRPGVRAAPVTAIGRSLPAATTGWVGEKLGISFGPLLSVEFPEGGFRVELLNDLFTNSFDVADGAFNTVKDTYEIFYTRTLPVGVNLEKPGVVQELIAYNETRQINIAASNLAFSTVNGTRPAITNFVDGVAKNIANTPQFFTWTVDINVANADLDGGSVNVRDIVNIDARYT